jgi:hypothetical protein
VRFRNRSAAPADVVHQGVGGDISTD